MKRDFILNRIIKVMLLVLSMTVGQNALAESSWTVENSNGNSNTFTIKRSEKGYSQKVLYRTVSLSAYAGQHYTAKYGELEFLENEDTKTVTVTESTPNVDSYKYQNGATRQYKLEVTDRAGLLLASATRDMTIGYNVASSGVFDNKSYTIRSSEVTVTEDGYAQSSNPHTVASTQFYTEGTKAYLVYLNAELRMRLEFQAKEVNDGYQYVQILTDNTTGCDTGAGDGNPGTPNVSHYMAGFDIGGKGVDTYYKYSFPVTSVGNDAGATKPWTELSNSVADLKKQKFNTGCRASDGRLILPTGFSTLVVRLNASGSDEDDWKAKDIKAFIQASDATMPTKLSVSAAPGRHAKGNTVYVSVAFSEIVTVTGTPTLTTTSDNHWGSLSYVEGSGTNVLTFSTTIPQDATGSLNITGLSGTVKDLAGNSLTGSGVTTNNLCSVDADDISLLSQEGGKYLITCRGDLHILSSYVNDNHNCSGKTFLQVTNLTFPHTTDWDDATSEENNFTAIGDEDHPFQGTYDGDGLTISGIRIYKGGDINSVDNCQGLFGKVGSGGTVKRVTLADARITGRHYTGGIAGVTFSCTIEDCTVEADVCIHAVQIGTYRHGGIVGFNQETVRRCISRATLTVANASGCNYFGGIVGYNANGGTITDCIAEGAVIPNVNGRGAIVGYKQTGTLTRNYYRGCTVAGVENATNVGTGSGDITDNQGALPLYLITLGTNVTINRTPATDPLPGTDNYTYANGADIAGVPYGYEGATIVLGYSGEVATGYHVVYTATAGTIDGSTLTMPAEAVSIGTTFSANSYTVHFDANGGSGSMSDMSFTYDAAQNLTANAFTAATGYVFNGWNTRADGNGTSYTDQQATPNVTADDGATVTLYAQWTDVWGMDGSADGTEAHPYTITTTAGLDLLATDVNNGNNYSGKYFVLGDDIAYPHTTDWDDATSEENNYTAIGKYSEDKYFAGKFNGQYHTISGIRIYKPNDSYQGLFGKISDGAHVKNVTLADARITANIYVGGIAGNTYSWITKIDNCLILNAAITARNSYGGALVGYKDAGTYSHNFYRNCIVKVGSNTYTTNIGLGAPRNDYVEEVGSVHTLTLPNGVTASGESVVIDDVTYYANKNTITLSGLGTEHTDGDITFRSRAIVTYNTNQTLTANADADGQATFTMPAADATVTAKEYAYTVKYIDADGNEQTCTEATLLEGSSEQFSNYGADGQENWYVVYGDITYSGQICFLNSHSHIILCDGATLSVSSIYEAIYGINGSITIYGQSQQSGAITATGGIGGIMAYGHVTINGGSVTASGEGGIITNYNITVNRGSVSATGNVRGISGNYVTINGGIVNATGAWDGISADGNITLGWSDASDRLTASSYYSKEGTVSVKAGQAFYDGTDYYIGTLSTDQINAMAGKTLQPAVTYIDENGQEQSKNLSDVTIIESSDGNVKLGNIDVERWYAVSGNVTINGQLNFIDKNVHLILCDGASLTVNCATMYAIWTTSGNLTIYGQSAQSGTVNATSNSASAINSPKDVIINGGTVTASGYYGINAVGNVIINGGTVTAHCSNNYYAIYGDNNVTINGGIINVDSPYKAIYAYSGTLTLGWSDATDRITASSYGTRYGTIQVKAGQAFYDGADYYTGTLSTDQINAMAGKTLQPAVTYSITLPEHVSASGTVTRLNGTTYATAGATVTLSTETGNILSSVTVNGTPATDNGDGTWSYSMPAQDVTVAATVTMPPVTYIDADGIEQSCTYYTLLTSDDDISNATNNQGYLPGGWYVVDGYIDFPYLQFSGDVHIILADGARLDVYDGINSRYDLIIYGQAAGSGELLLNNSIYCNNICINGGIINNYNGTYGIQANGNVTINGGTIHIESGNDYGIYANGYVTINGGTLSFNSIFGFVTSKVILASSTSLKTLNITRDFFVHTISLDRTFTVGKPASVMLPFGMGVNTISGGTFYTFGGVEKENDRWVATMNAVTDFIEPNTPYLVMPTETSLTFNNGTYLCTEGGGGGQTADEGSHWTFKGTYDYIKWTTDTSDPDYTAERAAEIGRVYGFAGVQKEGIEVGDFVKVASGARIRPMSAYLMWSDTPNAQNAPMRGSSRTGSAQELPQSITVRLLDASGTVTNVGEIDTVTGEISFAGWYTLQGVKLDTEPTEPGLYINNGKKVSIK